VEKKIYPPPNDFGLRTWFSVPICMGRLRYFIYGRLELILQYQGEYFGGFASKVVNTTIAARWTYGARALIASCCRILYLDSLCFMAKGFPMELQNATTTMTCGTESFYSVRIRCQWGNRIFSGLGGQGCIMRSTFLRRTLSRSPRYNRFRRGS
jgi:hypothetical protein